MTLNNVAPVLPSRYIAKALLDCVTLVPVGYPIINVVRY